MRVTWVCLKKFGHLPCSREVLIIEVMGMMRLSRLSRTRKVGQGSREHDLLGELIMILVTSSSVTVEKVERIGGGESGMMCCDLEEVGKAELNFSIFSVKFSKNLSTKSRGEFIDGSILAGSLCNTSQSTRHNLFGSW